MAAALLPFFSIKNNECLITAAENAQFVCLNSDFTIIFHNGELVVT